MFSEHQLIQRAATECMCNMTMCEQIFDEYDRATSSEKMKVKKDINTTEKTNKPTNKKVNKQTNNQANNPANKKTSKQANINK